MFSFGKSRLRKAIERGIAQGDLEKELEELGEVSLVSKADAEAVLHGLRHFEKADGGGLGKTVEPLVRVFQEVGGEKAFRVLHEEGISILLGLFDRISTRDEEDRNWSAMLILKAAAHFLSLEGALKVVAEAQRPFRPDEYLWSVVMQAFNEDHPHTELVFRSFRDSLPPGFAGISLLDAANARLQHAEDIAHPFDTEEGMLRLRGWLASDSEDEASYARSATAALPFINHPGRDALLELAMAHGDAAVGMKAAWAAAKLGREIGFNRLAEFSGDVRHGQIASQYLTELGRGELIPAIAKDPAFLAMAEFSQWLAYPTELGRAPDELEVMDHRTLNWPPEGESKPFWLIKYRLRDTTGLGEDDVGCGLVGSVTFCLFSYGLENRPPEDGYAIHCYWEMECAKLILDSDVDEDAADYQSMLSQWTGNALEDPQMLRVAELDPILRLPQRLVGVASARLDGAEGWVVLDGDRSEWYGRDEMLEDTSAALVLKIHVGRRLLGFQKSPARTAGKAPPSSAKQPEVIIAAYEKLLAEAAAKEGRAGKEAFEHFGPLGRHFDSYIESLTSLGRNAKALETIELLRPHWNHNSGFGKLGTAAFSCGDRALAEELFLQLRHGCTDFERCGEMGGLAEIWHGRGEHDRARELMLECLGKLVASSKSATGSDKQLFEKWFQGQRQAFSKLFPAEVADLLPVHGIPESTLS